MIMRTLCYFGLLLWLTACTSMTPPAQNQLLGWKQRSKQLAAISQWTLQGAAAIRTPENAWSASLFWQQSPQKYTLQLFGPLGVNRIQLVGSREQVTLLTPSQPPCSAKDPETLLKQELGWQLPVSHLRYWIRGIPAPKAAAKITWDQFHHITRLQQDNWIIDYQEYGNINGIDLPAKIQLHSIDLQVKLVIRQWHI